MALLSRPEDLIGLELGGLRIVAFLAAGGMGWVYRAENVLNPGIVRAVKVLRPDLATDEDFQRSFSREAEAIERLRHPGVVGFYGLRAERGYLVMEQELLEGEDLRTVLARGRLPVETALRWLRAAAEAVGAAHALTPSIVHRDLKPSNLFVTRAGTIKVLDFGLARSADPTGSSGTRVAVGTVAYMAPEVIINGGRAASPASDVYALGMTAWEMLAGEHPFQAKLESSEYAVQHAHVHDAVPRVDALRPEVPGWLVDVIARAVAKHEADRPADGAALARELEGPPPPKRRLNAAEAMAAARGAESAKLEQAIAAPAAVNPPGPNIAPVEPDPPSPRSTPPEADPSARGRRLHFAELGRYALWTQLVAEGMLIAGAVTSFELFGAGGVLLSLGAGILMSSAILGDDARLGGPVSWIITLAWGIGWSLGTMLIILRG